MNPTGLPFGEATVDLGCGDRRDHRASLGLDWYASEDAHLRGSVLALPFRDGSLRTLWAHQVVEHLPAAGVAGRDPFFRFFDECWRVLRPGGRLFVDVPHAHGPDAFADPTHRRFFDERSFRWLYQPELSPTYPRRGWTLLGVRVSRYFPPVAHTGFRSRWVERLARLAWVGVPDRVHVALERPSGRA